MISYFKELENPIGYCLDLIDNRGYDIKQFNIEKLPIDFFEKYADLFTKIKNYDLLDDNNEKNKKIYLDFSKDCNDISIEYTFNLYINGYGLEESCLSNNGILKIEYLMNNFKKIFKNDIDECYKYFNAIYDQLAFSDNILTCKKNDIYSYLLSSMIMAKYQNKLTADDEHLFKEAINYIKNYKVEININKNKPIKFNLPNSWYITPNNYLYNSMGKNGHKSANLIYQFYYTILRDDFVDDPRGSFKKAKKILNEGCVDKFTFDDLTNLIYDFSCIYPDNYYDLDPMSKIRYNNMDKKTYNPKIINLIVGILNAQGSLYSFFYYLKKNSSNYYEDLELIKKMDLDEILIRCCGFHKISSVCNKTITTSCINYSEEFREYIEKGWRIDFVKPIVFNPYIKRMEEYSDEFLIIKSLHL